ncbi:MAG: universal stress protein [Candidatus Bathyarchaeia archaeon]|nr:universal stress protein [Candidatus Bathyarchaeota archaeon]
MNNEEYHEASILIPISTFIDKERLIKALHAISIFQKLKLVLFHVIELKSRTTPIEAEFFEEHTKKIKGFLDEVKDWLIKQGYNVLVKIVVARSISEGIIYESNSGDYNIVIMMKRKPRRGFKKFLHKSISEKVIKYTRKLVLIIPTDF